MMAHGTKRRAAQDPQSQSKKTKSSLKTTRISKATDSVSSPSNRVDEGNTDNIRPMDVIDQTEKTLGQMKLRMQTQDQWPSRFSQHLDKERANVLGDLESVRKKIDSEQAAFQQGILPLLRKALAPIDISEAREVEDEAVLEVPFTVAGHQDYIHQIVQLIDTSHRLIDTYHTLTKQEAEISPSRLSEVERDFEKDQQAALNTIDSGRRVAARDVETMLADRYNEIRGRSNLTREDEQKGRMLLSKSENDDEDNREAMGWGTVAADARKAIHKLDRVGRLRQME